MKDYYQTLGVGKDASSEEIKSAYKKLAKKYHPDINKEEDATERFKEVNEAASVLGNPEKKAQYDRVGHDAFKHAGRTGGAGPGAEGFDFSGARGGFDFDDIFDMFTGGFGRQPRQQRGDDLRYDLAITLEEAAEGVKKRIRVRKHAPCETCKGKGGKGVKTCQACQGRGVRMEARRTPFGVFQSTTTCGTCGGAGQQVDEPCDECDGLGIVMGTKDLDVSIPSGVDNGTRVRLTGEGDAGPRGSHAGDLYIFIAVEPHEIFTRDGEDLSMEAPVSFATLAMGGEITIPTLEGEADLKIPKGTQSHTIFRLKGKGMPHLHGKGHGDQFVKVVARTPEKLTRRQQKALEEFAEDEDEKGWLSSLFERIRRS